MAANGNVVVGMNESPLKISTNVTTGKVTQGMSFGERLHAGLQQGASAVASGASLLGSAGLPGMGIVSAAVSSVAGSVGGATSASYGATGIVNVGGGAGGSSPLSTTVPTSGGTGTVSGGTLGTPNFSQGTSSSDVAFGNGAIASMSGDMSSMLKLQYTMQKENLVYTGTSNVLKTKHDTVKNSIGNIR